MNIPHLLFLLFRFLQPFPAEAIEPLPEPITVMEAPAYIHLETGETIYLEEGQDGTDVSMEDLF
jgi:hypothetical protein